MSALSRLLGRLLPEQKTSSHDIFLEMYGGRAATSGVTVNETTALRSSVVLACARLIANGLSQVPVGVFREGADGTLERQRGHAVDRLISLAPRDGVTSVEFRSTLGLHLTIKGNAYVWAPRVGIERRVAQMVILDPSRVTHQRRASTSSIDQEAAPSPVLYQLLNGPQLEIPADQVWHLRGLAWEESVGLETIDMARDAIGLSISAEQTQGDLHKNGLNTTGLYSVPETLSIEKFKSLASWLDMYERGGARSGKPLILSNGAAYTPQTMTLSDAQHIESRKFQVEEVCRALGVIPMMVGGTDKTATYASAEQMFIAHAVHTMDPVYERVAASATLNLLNEQEISDGYQIKFTPTELTRGTMADQSGAAATALGAGGQAPWMTQDEVRRMFGLNPLGGDAAKLGAGAMSPPPETDGDMNGPPDN